MPAVDCVINPYRVADIASPVTGIIDRLFVERSEKVSAGQLVARLVDNVEVASVELARYRASVQSEIELGLVNMNFDTRRKKRIKSLLEKQDVSEENADQVEREARLSRWKLKQARELLEIRKLELQRAEEQLRQKSIKAPFDGYVLDTFKYSGEYVEDQAILRLAQLDPLVVEAIVPMENFGLIKEDMDAEIALEVLFDEKLMANVTIIDRIGDTASNTFGVKLELPNPQNRIPAGLKCVLKFLPTSQEQLKAAKQRRLDQTQSIAESAIENEANANRFIDAEEVEDIGIIIRDKPSPVASPPVETPAPETTSTENIDIPQPVVEQQDSSETNPPQATSYLVLTKQGETEPETRAIINQLREAGMQDFLVVERGHYSGQIMLGLFSSRERAQNRSQTIENLGYTVSISERY